ncbi:MAG: phosphate ABC transporter substrate-binding protein [Methanobacteriaceae archaeon]|jgi:phosphate transport system substrate-binding protein|uniref:phosphate ABC transporter substrate-binding protein n=1 Tax=unclassified Methanobrevibacter TaxID=2638681 RepID=UPI003765AD51|nr:phosphate ABC transporter substrate-binding protein [Methanobacteriaceae archaeon]MDD4593594.1 phosphate ABC transporter substrate-binding protein [Methanobacteriaceae archaeon]
MKSKYKWIIGIIIVIIIALLLVVPGMNVQRMDIVGSTSVQPLAEELADAYDTNHSDIKISVQGGGSGMGIRSTHQGIADIGMSSKELDSSDKQNITEVELGKEGIVIGVNNGNNISDLSSSQIKGIFNGNITNWKEVGGPDQEIHVITREEGSGTRDAFTSLIMDKSDIMSSAIVQSSTESVKQAVSTDPGAIGYMSFAHMSNDVKSLSVDGVQPSEETISNGDYELQRPFLFLIKGKPTGEVNKFLEWVKSPEGTKIIEENKIIPVS